jgi:hypothetical protein
MSLFPPIMRAIVLSAVLATRHCQYRSGERGQHHLPGRVLGFPAQSGRR